MTQKTTLLKPTTFNDFASLYRFLRSAPMRPLFVLCQIETIADVVDGSLPADLMIEQRSPKGTVYLHVDGMFFGRVNAAGRYLPPGGKGAMGTPLTKSNLARFARPS